MWMIVMKSSENYPWPWADAGDNAEAEFAKQIPAIHSHLTTFRDTLKARQDQGRYWWELRSCSYWSSFDEPKLCIQRIAFHPRVGLDTTGMFLNDSAIIVPTTDTWTLGCLNSAAMWYFSFRHFPHKKDEALSMDIACVEELPIPEPSEKHRNDANSHVTRLIEIKSLRWFHARRYSIG